MNNNIKGSILVVDDNLENLRILIKMLTEQGYKVRPAPNASLAMRSAQSTVPDLILLDIRMPDMNGYEVCEILKADEQTRDVPIIFISALDEPMDKIKAFEAGAVDYITKPFQLEEVLARVRTHITLRDIQKQLLEQNTQLQQEIFERKQAEKALEEANYALEFRVEHRTRELAIANEELSQEIDVRKKAEASLRESEQRLKTIFDSVNAGIIIVNAETRIVVDANPTALKMIGAAKDKIIGQDYHNFICRTEKDKCPFANLNQSVENMEHLLMTPDGKSIPILKTVTPIFLDGVKHFLDSFIDITELRKTEEERVKLENRLRHAQKMEAIGTLAGGIAHDFNNILFPIFGYVEISMETVPKDSKFHRHLTEIFKAAQRAKDLVQQILTFSRQCEQEHKPFKIQSVIKEALKMMRSMLPTSIEFKINIDNKCGPIMGDPTQIHQIVMNLCTNAFHAMQDTGGVLEVTLKDMEIKPDEVIGRIDIKPGKYLRLTVSDTGPGMTRDVMDRIFEPYFTTKEKGKGTGLGLSVVHGIVQSHAGKITVYSELNQGTIFHVYLPMINYPSATVESAISEPIKRGNEHILLVDDEAEIVDMEKQILETLGYHVTAFTSSIELLNTFQAQPNQFDLIITDMTMPNMMGDRLAKTIKEIRPDIPIILCTGFSEQINSEKSQLIGIQELVMKPITINEFARVIRKVLDTAPK